MSTEHTDMDEEECAAIASGLYEEINARLGPPLTLNDAIGIVENLITELGGLLYQMEREKGEQ